MARSLNQCNFIGNLGQDPEIRLTQSGETIANISLGCSDDYKDKQSGNIIQRTNWVRISAFGNTAEVIKNYCRKGSKLFVTGKQVTRKYQAQDGSDRYSTEIQANNIQLLDSRNDNQQNQQQQQNQPQAPNNQQSRNNNQNANYNAQQRQPAQQGQARPSNYDSVPHASQHNQAPAPNFDEFDSEIPF